jgi:hypothetical protein
VRRPLSLLALPLLLLVGCGPTPAPAPTDDSPATSKPTETVGPPAAELDPDVLLVVSTRATAENGAALDLVLTVHRATAWSDDSAADRPALMTTTCEGYLDAGVYEANLWSFVTADVTATSTGTAEWPADTRIRLFPTPTDDVSLASGGFLVEDPDVDSATPHCARDRYLYGPGDGSLIAGIQGDTDEAAAAGNFTRWANQLWGFTGASFSNCSYVVTPAGAELNGGAEWWSEQVDDSNCYVGSTAG